MSDGERAAVDGVLLDDTISFDDEIDTLLDSENEPVALMTLFCLFSALLVEFLSLVSPLRVISSKTMAKSRCKRDS